MKRAVEAIQWRGDAPIAQLAEAADLKSAQCRFESVWGHRLRGEREQSADCEAQEAPSGWETASELKAQERETGRPARVFTPRNGPCPYKPLRVSGLSERSKIRRAVLADADSKSLTRPTFGI